MIIDSIENAPAYFSLHPLFAAAFDYINKNAGTALMGKYDIDGENLKAIFSSKEGMTSAESIAKFECHNHHIDIQVCLGGRESFGWKPRKDCKVENGSYNAEKDVQLYSEEPDMYFMLNSGQFVIFFPGDVHAPMIGEGEIKKLVIKVKIQRS